MHRTKDTDAAVYIFILSYYAEKTNIDIEMEGNLRRHGREAQSEQRR